MNNAVNRLDNGSGASRPELASANDGVCAPRRELANCNNVQRESEHRMAGRDRRSLALQARQARQARKRGFSLIELMVVLVILGLLTGLVGPRLFGRVDASKVQTAETQIKMLRGALQTYRLDIGAYPSTAEGLEALMSPPAEIAEYWHGPYLEDELPLDPWREPYKYEQPAETLQGFALYSLGADSESGGEDIDSDVGYLPE